MDASMPHSAQRPRATPGAQFSPRASAHCTLLSLALFAASGAHADSAGLGSGLSYQTPAGDWTGDVTAGPQIEFATALGRGELFAGTGTERFRPGYPGLAQQDRATRLWLGYRMELAPSWSLGLRWQQIHLQRTGIDALDDGFRASHGSVGLRHVPGRGPVEWIEAEWLYGPGADPRLGEGGLSDRLGPPATSGFRISAKIPLGATGWFRRIELEPGFSRFRSDGYENRAGDRIGSAPGQTGTAERAEWKLGAGLRLSW